MVDCISHNVVLTVVCKIELCRDVLLKDNEEKKKADDKRPLMLKVYKLVIYNIGHMMIRLKVNENTRMDL
jgi:hypothetical protein